MFRCDFSGLEGGLKFRFRSLRFNLDVATPAVAVGSLNNSATSKGSSGFGFDSDIYSYVERELSLLGEIGGGFFARAVRRVSFD